MIIPFKGRLNCLVNAGLACKLTLENVISNLYLYNNLNGEEFPKAPQKNITGQKPIPHTMGISENVINGLFF